jgi:hypothetical protein
VLSDPKNEVKWSTMHFKLETDNRGKLILIGASVLMWVVILILFKTITVETTWQLWKVPTTRMPFMDFRLIPGSADSFANGYEPSVENPYDPNKRIFNYPAFWRLFFYTGMRDDDTVAIGITMIILFFISAFLFPEKLSISAAMGMLFILFSPASMLLYERGNVDLFVFFVCAMAVVATSYSAYIATGLILFAAIMKLFPILGLSALLKEPKKKFLWLSGFSVLVLVIYMLATWSSVQASWNTTMRGDGLSYGTDVFVDRYSEAIRRVFSYLFPSGFIDPMLQYAPLVVALLLLLAVIVLAFRNPEQMGTLTERNFAAFRMGAAIYVGTFLLGNNWDYRLAFLVILVPQLVEWMRSSQKSIQLTSWLSFLLILLSCWHLRIVEIPMNPIFNTVHDSRKFWIILDEIFNWLLFASLAYLLFASTPEWVKELPRNILSKVGIHPRYSHEQNRSSVP